ncbi:MAG TPA: squalene/phytoene synthase family protein [Steroidobacteraceae bacterium]|jgi:phytoene synthase
MAETPDWHPARYLAPLYSPPSERPVLEALFGVESEVVASVRGGLEHQVAHIRLQWWREECERAAKGQAVHPFTKTLVEAFGSSAGAGTPSPLAGLAGFLDTAVWDLAASTFETRREVTAYCERWATAMIVIAARHATEARADNNARAAGDAIANRTPGSFNQAAWLSLGAAMHEIEMLANLASEARAGRLRVPLDELESAGIDPDCVARPPWPAALNSLLLLRHQTLRVQVAGAVAEIERDHQPNARGLLVWAALARQRSVRAERALPEPLSISRFEAIADGWLAWRSARHATNGTFTI